VTQSCEHWDVWAGIPFFPPLSASWFTPDAPFFDPASYNFSPGATFAPQSVSLLRHTHQFRQFHRSSSSRRTPSSPTSFPFDSVFEGSSVYPAALVSSGTSSLPLTRTSLDGSNVKPCRQTPRLANFENLLSANHGTPGMHLRMLANTLL
jgi:hypothetical protein